MEVGDRVNETHLVAVGESPVQLFREQIGHHAVAVAGDGDELRPLIVHVQRVAEKRRLLGDDVIAAVDGGADQQVADLRAARSDEDLVARNGAPETGRHPGAEKVQQRRIAFGGTVLEDVAPLLAQDRRAGVKFLHGEHFRRGHAARETDHAGLTEQMKHVADRRGTNAERGGAELLLDVERHGKNLPESQEFSYRHRL